MAMATGPEASEGQRGVPWRDAGEGSGAGSPPFAFPTTAGADPLGSDGGDGDDDDAFASKVSQDILQYVKRKLLVGPSSGSDGGEGNSGGSKPLGTGDLHRFLRDACRAELGARDEEAEAEAPRPPLASAGAQRPTLSSFAPPLCSGGVGRTGAGLPYYKSKAQTCYKIVALTPDGRCLSVYDGVTEYRPGLTLHCKIDPAGAGAAAGAMGAGAGGADALHQGGFYVYGSVEECLLAHEHFPRSATLLGAKKAIARVLCWNGRDNRDDHDDHGGQGGQGGGEKGGRHGDAARGKGAGALEEEGAPPGGGGSGGSGVEAEVPRYGNKKVFEYVRLVEVLPFPAGSERVAPPTATGPQAQRRLSVIKARAKTIALKEEVQRMEERLRVTRFISHAERGVGMEAPGGDASFAGDRHVDGDGDGDGGGGRGAGGGDLFDMLYNPLHRFGAGGADLAKDLESQKENLGLN